MNSSLVMLGYDYGILSMQGVKVPLHAKIQSHRIVVGSTNSGKSSAILYWIYKASKLGCEFYIADFKQSHEFEGITSYFAEFEACYALIEQFYQEFLNQEIVFFGCLCRGILPQCFLPQVEQRIIFRFALVLEGLRLKGVKDYLQGSILMERKRCGLDRGKELFL